MRLAHWLPWGFGSPKPCPSKVSNPQAIPTQEWKRIGDLWGAWPLTTASRGWGVSSGPRQGSNPLPRLDAHLSRLTSVPAMFKACRAARLARQKSAWFVISVFSRLTSTRSGDPPTMTQTTRSLTPRRPPIPRVSRLGFFSITFTRAGPRNRPLSFTVHFYAYKGGGSHSSPVAYYDTCRRTSPTFFFFW